MNSFRTLKVHYDSTYAIVGFYRGSSPESIRKVIGKALSLPPKGIKLLTMNGGKVAEEVCFPRLEAEQSKRLFR